MSAADWDNLWGNKFGADDDDDDNEEEGGDFQRYQWGTRDGLIFLIDCTKPMFDSKAEMDSEEEGSPFELCIKCAKCVIQNKIISSDKDLLGIVFFGTEKEKNPTEFKHIYVFHDLGQPGAERVLELDALLDEPDNDNFKTKFGHSNSFSLSDALWTCSNMFSNCSQKLGYKRILLFTNNDNPHGNNAQLKRQAQTKAEDLHQNGIELELMHINQEAHDFDVGLFYKDVLFMDDDENVVLADPAAKFEELLTRVRSKDHKKRAMTRIPLSLGEDLNLSVGVYTLVRKTDRPGMVKLYKKTNEEVKSVTKTFLAETGEVLMPQDMKKAQVYGGKMISFEQEEVKEIKKFDKPGLRLMGFKPRSSLKRYFHVKPAQFIYPDETIVQGSTTAFTALLKKCLERDVIAICRYIPRRNTPPKFVALLGQGEELDENNVQVLPPGFHLIFLPFADDFRKLNYEENMPRAETVQVDAAKKIIKKLQFKFRPDSFENPALQQHYANVEAMALDRDTPEEVTDFAKPNEELIAKRAGKLIEEFKDVVFPEGYTPGAKKRGGGAGGGPAAKKGKTEDIDVEKEARAGRLNKLTVPVLKDFVKQAKIRNAGTKKAELVDAIMDHFGIS